MALDASTEECLKQLNGIRSVKFVFGAITVNRKKLRKLSTSPTGYIQLTLAPWMKTAMLVLLDLKEIIIPSGENIYPWEIEDYLFTHPKIAEVAIFGIPDEYYGEVVMAWIQIHKSETATDQKIRKFCKAQQTDK